ncbi:MAG: hypothetical protein WD767_03980 [Alphaproteobacteria bacterium]
MMESRLATGCCLIVVAVAAAGIVGCGVGFMFDGPATVAAWMTMALFVLGLSLGAITVLMIHMLTGGAWGRAMYVPLRAAVTVLPLGLLLLLPVAGSLGLVFPWADGDLSGLSETARRKLAYLNTPFFLVRFAVCSVLWLCLAWLVLRWTLTADTAAGTVTRRRYHQRNAAIGLIVHVIAISVFSVDWMMSLEPEFYSSMYPLLEISGQMAAAHALAILVLAALDTPIQAADDRPGVSVREDTANMLFGFVLIWVYLAFMQWLIVWAADLPIEIHWYLLRVEGGWRYILWLLIILHFAVPFAAFLNRAVKRSRSGVMALGCIILIGHFLDVLWRVRPPVWRDSAIAGWIDGSALLAAGGLFSLAYLVALSRSDRIDSWLGRRARAG